VQTFSDIEAEGSYRSIQHIFAAQLIAASKCSYDRLVRLRCSQTQHRRVQHQRVKFHGHSCKTNYNQHKSFGKGNMSMLDCADALKLTLENCRNELIAWYCAPVEGSSLSETNPYTTTRLEMFLEKSLSNER
jgi:hypothetical protein